MNTIVPMITLFGLMTASILLVVWLFRPSAKKKYEKHGNIPLKD